MKRADQQNIIQLYENLQRSNDPYDILLSLLRQTNKEKQEASIDNQLIYDFLTVISQIYNGGFQQIVENQYLEEYEAAIKSLNLIPNSSKAETLQQILLRHQPDLQHFSERVQALSANRGEWPEVEEDYEIAESELNEKVDKSEDWIYNRNNMNPIYEAFIDYIQNNSSQE